MILTSKKGFEANLQIINHDALCQTNKENLERGFSAFVYVTRKGDRQALGTLHTSLIANLIKEPEAVVQLQVDKSTRDNSQYYFDLEKLSWRCYKTINLLAIINQ